MNEDFYISLLYQQLEGSISDEEAKQLSEWIAKNPENQALADDLATVYSSSEHYLSAEIEAVDVNTAFQQQVLLIEEEAPAKVIQMQPKRTRTFRLSRTLRVAAAVVLLAVAGWWTYDTLSEPTFYQIQAYTEQDPINMTDGSVIDLTKGSSIWLNGGFRKSNRHIKFEGQGFFNIQKSKIPFIIETKIGKVTVLGTKFDLVYDKETETMTVKVTEGLVNLELKNGKSQKVKGGQAATASLNENTVTISEEKVNLVLNFKDTPLRRVAKQLRLKYGIEINVKKSIEECKVNIRAENKELDTVFKTLEKTLLGIKVEKVSDGFYYIGGSSENCKN